MGIKIKIKKRLDEMSSVSGGAIQGYGAPFGTPKGIDAFNKKEAEEQRLKGERLDEMFSSSGLSGRNRRPLVSGEDEHAGHVERSRHQGLKNVMQEDDDATFDLGNDSLYDDTFSLEIDTADALSSSKVNTQISKIAESFYNHGYKMVKYLGSGKFGRVVKVEHLDTGASYAAKIIGITDVSSMNTDVATAVKKETTIYSIVKDLGDQSILEHFPEIFEVWTDVHEGQDLGFIVMELLEPANPDETAFIPDASDMLARKYPGLPIQTRAISPDARDQSVKAKTLIRSKLNNLVSLAKVQINSYLFDWDSSQGTEVLKPNLEPHRRKIENMILSISPSSLKRYENMDEEKAKNLIDSRIKRIEKIPAVDRNRFLEIYNVIASEVTEASYIIVIFLELCFAVAASSYISGSKMVTTALENFAMGFINAIRGTTSIKIGYKSSELKKGQRGASGPESDLFDAIVSLYQKTGLIAKDMHDKNVMKRATGELVIVDLGLFRKDPSWRPQMSESRRYCIKLLTNPKK